MLTSQLSFDMSLARGLDYYTGIIYEAITEVSAPPSISTDPSVPASKNVTDSKSKSKKSKDGKAEDGPDESTVGVGSIAGGGRYDNLVGMFSEAAGQGKKEPVPCVGVSVGVERVYSIMEMRRRQGDIKVRGKETDVYIMNFGKEGLLKERMALAKKLRDAGIKVRDDAPMTLFVLTPGRVHVQGEPERQGPMGYDRQRPDPLRRYPRAQGARRWNLPNQGASRQGRRGRQQGRRGQARRCSRVPQGQAGAAVVTILHYMH